MIVSALQQKKIFVSNAVLFFAVFDSVKLARSSGEPLQTSSTSGERASERASSAPFILCKHKHTYPHSYYARLFNHTHTHTFLHYKQWTVTQHRPSEDFSNFLHLDLWQTLKYSLQRRQLYSWYSMFEFISPPLTNARHNLTHARVTWAPVQFIFKVFYHKITAIT